MGKKGFNEVYEIIKNALEEKGYDVCTFSEADLLCGNRGIVISRGDIHLELENLGDY